MPTPHMNRVRDFMHRAGQATPNKPITPSDEQRILRARLIMEEALETIQQGLGVDVVVDADEYEVLLDFDTLDFKITRDFDQTEAIDGAADLRVVTTGLFVDAGVDDETVQEEVDSANLQKFGPGGYRHPETGKWIKPPNFTPPDIQAAISRGRLTKI